MGAPLPLRDGSGFWDRAFGIILVSLQCKSFIFPIHKIIGRVARHTYSIHTRCARAVIGALVFAVPIIFAVMFYYTSTVSLYIIAVCVLPDMSVFHNCPPFLLQINLTVCILRSIQLYTSFYHKSKHDTTRRSFRISYVLFRILHDRLYSRSGKTTRTKNFIHKKPTLCSAAIMPVFIMQNTLQVRISILPQQKAAGYMRSRSGASSGTLVHLQDLPL